MKKVVSESTVAHLWAHQAQEEARKSNGSFYFHKRVIYSYGSHFPIAEIDENNSNIVYFTTRTYSNTTAGHISTASRAVGHKTLIYCKYPTAAAEKDHEANMTDFEEKAKQIAKSLPNSRKPEIYLTQIATQRSLMEKYVEHFGLDIQEYPFAYIYIRSKDGTTEASEKELEAMKVAEKIRLKKDKRELAKQLKLFRTFKIERIRTKINIDYLRFNEESLRIETSQGVEIPVEAAKRFYSWALKTIKAGGCSGDCKETILSYQVQSIDNSFMKIGCHNIPVSEAAAIAEQLKW